MAFPWDEFRVRVKKGSYHNSICGLIMLFLFVIVVKEVKLKSTGIIKLLSFSHKKGYFAGCLVIYDWHSVSWLPI